MLKKLNLNFFGQDGNAFALLGYFRRKAKQAGWTSEEIKKRLMKRQAVITNT